MKKSFYLLKYIWSIRIKKPLKAYKNCPTKPNLNPSERVYKSIIKL
jgi:hypothetical protein